MAIRLHLRSWRNEPYTTGVHQVLRHPYEEPPVPTLLAAWTIVLGVARLITLTLLTVLSQHHSRLVAQAVHAEDGRTTHYAAPYSSRASGSLAPRLSYSASISRI